ncbi:MAG: S9 family peptidase [Novosphingobium sp.]|nr:S9 family peptidase [Novosphingobium sp.]
MRAILAAAFGGLLMMAAPALAKEPPPLDAYGDLPGVEDMAISPNGNRIAAISRIKLDRKLLVTEDGTLVSTTQIGDMKVRGLEWAGNDIIVLEKSDSYDLPFGFTADKTELFSAIALNLKNNKHEVVFSNSAALGNAVFGSYGLRRIEGRWTGFFAGLKYKRSADRTGWEFDHGRPYLFAVDLENNRPRQVSEAARDGRWRDWLVDGRGNVAATFDMTENGAWSIRNAGGKEIASGADPMGNAALVSFGRTNASLIYRVMDNSAAMLRWFEVPLAGGAPSEPLAHATVDALLISKTDSTLQGYLTYEEMRTKPVLFDPRLQEIFSKVYRAFPKLDVTLVDSTPDFGKFIVLTRGNGESGTYYTIDMTRMRADPIGYERPSIHPEQVGPISTVDYKAGDGLELDGILTLPPGREPKNLPVVMLPHGGPSSHDIETFDWWAQAFASRGYAVFQPNFRGSTNRDVSFRNAGDGQWGRKMQSDISDGLAELAKRGVVDPKRACIMGGSYGGYAALAGVTLQQGLYRCAVAVAPVSDLEDMYWAGFVESGRNKLVRRNYLEALGDRSKFAEVSPRRHAGNADAPILLIHGKDDTVVAFDQSARMADALKGAGKPYEFVTLVEEDHWLSKAATRKQMLEEAMRFVQKYNPAD